MNQASLSRSIQLLMFVVLVTVVLYYGKPLIIPVIFGALIAMLFLPLSEWLQSKGLHRILSIICCLLIFLTVVAGIVSLVSWQIADLAKDADQIQQNLTQKVNQLKEYITESFGVSKQKQQQVVDNQQESSSGQLGSTISGLLTGFGSFLANFIIVLVYIFLFMYYRDHLKNFVLKLTAKEKQHQAKYIIQESSKVAKNYLVGLGMMIVCLWVLYGIGFSIVGVKNAIFFAILCGLLEIIPLIGNLLGSLLTLMVSFAQGAETNVLLGIIITYAIVQFVQTYLLEPLVVGKEVSINPVATIFALVAGEIIWGIPGMILAIPIIGITKIVCDNIESLKPYGFLLGEKKTAAKNKKPPL